MTALLEVAELKFGPRLECDIMFEFIPFIISESLMSVTMAKMKERVERGHSRLLRDS